MSHASPPSFCLIIGAAKAGTTSLFDILAHHPQVSGSALKETRFFSWDERFEKGIDWYEREYFSEAPAGVVRLEATPSYLTWSEKTAPRIRQTLRDRPPALVAIFRDPVGRAYSHYWHRVRMGHETLPFTEALAQEDARLRANWDTLSREGNGKYGYARAGCYASRLRPFLEHFDRQQMHFLLQEDLRPDVFPQSIARLLNFLRIDDTIALAPVRRNAPKTPRHRGLLKMYRRLKKQLGKTAWVSIVPWRIRRGIEPLFYKPTDYPPIDPEVERQLRVRFADEVRQCQDLIQRDLSHWLPS